MGRLRVLDSASICRNATYGRTPPGKGDRPLLRRCARSARVPQALATCAGGTAQGRSGARAAGSDHWRSPEPGHSPRSSPPDRLARPAWRADALPESSGPRPHGGGRVRPGQGDRDPHPQVRRHQHGRQPPPGQPHPVPRRQPVMHRMPEKKWPGQSPICRSIRADRACPPPRNAVTSPRRSGSPARSRGTCRRSVRPLLIRHPERHDPQSGVSRV